MPVKIKNAAKDKLILGVNIACDLVKQTYGFEGATIIMDNQLHPVTTKDGYKVVKEIHEVDTEVNMGVALIKEVADSTAKTAEDGTTTACILAQSIINKGYELIKKGVSHVDIREGILQAKADINERLNLLSLPVTVENVYEIAKVSANGDHEVANLIKEAYTHINKEGLLEVQRTTSLRTTLEVIQGIKINRGWLAPHFMTDSQKLIATLDRVQILLFDGHITDLEKQVLPAIKICQESKTSLFIICDEIDDKVADSLISNKLNNTFQSCVVRNPEYGVKRLQVLQDLQSFVGGEIYNPNYSKTFELGKASKIIVGQNDTLIHQEEVQDTLQPQINLLKEQFSSDTSDKSLEKRISNLSSNGACIFVGGQSTSEIGEKFDRVEDAIGAVKCALEEGTVAGGGSTLLYISNQLANSKNSIGYNLMLEAIKAPYSQLLENAGIVKSKYIFGKDIPKPGFYGEVFNLKTRRLENSEDSGIKDSVKVLKTALDNATSIAILILSTNGIITI